MRVFFVRIDEKTLTLPSPGVPGEGKSGPEFRALNCISGRAPLKSNLYELHCKRR